MSHRKVPRPRFGYLKRGYCQWCGEVILHESGKRKGEVNTRRGWHPDCVYQYKLHAFPEYQVAFVKKRDGERCRECGETPMKNLRGPEVVDVTNKTRWCEVSRVIALELDHIEPLWSVQHLAPDERRRFYGPENLQLLCHAHHVAKCAREAAVRAAQKRQQRAAA